MTDGELVEKVAREVMGYGQNQWYLINSEPPVMRSKPIMGESKLRWFRPLADMNDLQLVKDKLREMGWQVHIDIYLDGKADVVLLERDSLNFVHAIADTEARAICEASINAMEG